MEASTKKYLIGTAAVAALLVVVLLVAPSFVDWNNYKSEISAQASRLTGREATISGDIRLAVLPSPTLFVEDVRVASLPGAESVDFLTVRSVELDVALLPLLSGTIQVERLILIEPVVELEILHDGTQTWAFEAGEEGGSGSKTEISMDRVVVEKGRVSFKDVRTGSHQVVEDLDAVISAKSLEGPFSVEAALRYGARDISFDARVGRMGGRSITPLDLKIVSGRDLVRGEFNGALKRGKDGFSAEGKIKVSGDQLNGVLSDLVAPEEPVGEFFGAFGEAPVVLEADANISGANLRLTGAELKVGDISGRGALSVALGEAPAFKLLLAVGSVDLKKILAKTKVETGTEAESAEPKDAVEGEDAVQSAGYALPKAWRGEVEVTADALSYGDGAIRQTRLAAKLEGGEIRITSLGALLPGASDLALSGTIAVDENSSVFSGRVNLASSNLRALLGWLDIDAASVAKGRLTRLSMSGAVTVNADVAQIHGMEMAVDTTKITGGLAYAIQDRPSFSANLKIDRLDADSYFGAGEDDDENDGQNDGQDKEWLDRLKILGDFDTRLKLDIGKLRYERFSLADVSLDLSLIDGAMTLSRLEVGNLNGLRAKLAGKVRGFGGKLDSDLTLTGNADQLGQLVQVLKLPITSSAARGNPLSFRMNIKGGLERAALEGEGNLGRTHWVTAGDVGAWRSDDPEINIRLDVRNPSLGEFAAQWELEMVEPVPGADGPLTLKGTVSGKKSDLAFNWGAQAAGGRLTLTGSVKGLGEAPAYEVAGTAKAANFESFLRGVGVDVSPGPRGSKNKGLGASFRLDGNEERVVLEDVSLRVGPIELAGHATLDLTGERPNLTAAIEGSAVDLNLILPELQTGPTAAHADATRRWSSEPFDLSALSEWDANVTLDAQDLRWRRYRFKGLKASAQLADGVLSLQDLNGVLFGGEIHLSAVLSSRGTPSLTTKVDFKNSSLAQALQAAGDLEAATGVFNLSGSFSASGGSQSAMISSLGGTAKFSARDGLVRGFDVPKFSRRLVKLKDPVGLVRLAAGTLSGGETAYSSAEAGVAVKGGVARIENGRAALDSGNAAISGVFDLPRWRMDAPLSIKLTDPALADAPAFGTRYRGAIDAPKSSYNVANILAYARNRLLFSGGGTQEQPGERTNGLRDLLGGGQRGTTQEPQGATEEEQQPTSPVDFLLKTIIKEVTKDGKEERAP